MRFLERGTEIEDALAVPLDPQADLATCGSVAADEGLEGVG